MNTFTKLLFSATVVVGSLLGGCKGKDGDPGPTGATGATGATGPSGQNLTGNLFGFVSPVDENGSVQSRAGVTVTLENTTPVQTATSDANGRYEFANLRNGTYNLTYSRAGYASLRRIGIGHVGGDQPTFLGTTSITQPSSGVVTNLALTGTSSSSSTVPFTLTLNNSNPTNATYRVSFFASTTPGVTAANGTLITTAIFTAGGTINSSLSKSSFTGAGFPIGAPVYVVAYAVSAINPTYIDPQNGRTVFTGVSSTASNVAFFLL
ncbi:hypothetical protein F0P96_15120 [Hymenobacter busanensis]|uniref:Uncharacterized protein n=1 Tax=Hymenobacter busanensis TaxID=2607656 RepID=A0A7L5A3X9_9BACT|nr:carboxypeptidase-like regulatory domain-containing protein [Hymenobacter busanensis]KAA9331566.1 hypothetical protein F0P96_15120 [Hymenobacter busanensis]QHJ08720.1 hypothetical protein GUY19_16055 [Hymenobacter busanensis]